MDTLEQKVAELEKAVQRIESDEFVEAVLKKVAVEFLAGLKKVVERKDDPGGQDALSQKDLYCIARHLFSFHSNALKKEVADYARPCSACEYALSGTCTNEPSALDPVPSFAKLSNLTGVKFSMCSSVEPGGLEGKRDNDRIHP